MPCYILICLVTLSMRIPHENIKLMKTKEYIALVLNFTFLPFCGCENTTNLLDIKFLGNDPF